MARVAEADVATLDKQIRAVLDAQAKKWGTVCVAEVDLNQRTLWPWLGDFKAQIPHQRPVARGE